MEILEFQYDPWVGLGFIALSLYIAIRVIWFIRSRRPSLASAPSLAGTLLIAIVLGWIGTDYLTWKAEFTGRGAAVSRKGLPAVLQNAFTHPSHSIGWREISAVRFNPGSRGRAGIAPTLSITGAGGTIKFPVESIRRDDARRLLTLLAACSPDFAIHVPVDELLSETDMLRDPILLMPRISVSRRLIDVRPSF